MKVLLLVIKHASPLQIREQTSEYGMETTEVQISKNNGKFMLSQFWDSHGKYLNIIRKQT
jgi:hypothetical protein